VFYLHMAQHMLAQNIIYIKPAKVGDLVWLDENRNGLLDGSEPRIPGVSISLVENGQVMYQTTSDAYGYYLFNNVYPGTYILQANAYPELGITTPVPELRIISSCLVSGDGVAAQSEPFTVQSGSSNKDYDLGYILLDGQQLPSAMVPPPKKDWTK
ncbi:MAG: SdrD B-like domain-containing protein, partial [Clostridia bacterium]